MRYHYLTVEEQQDARRARAVRQGRLVVRYCPLCGYETPQDAQRRGEWRVYTCGCGHREDRRE